MQRSEIEWMPIASIKPYDKNPRRNDSAVDAVANSITEFGFKNPIIVDSDLVIIAGHTRLKAAKKLGLKEVPVIIASDLTPEQVRAFRIIDNKTAELADWDEDLLKGEMLDLDIDWTEFGFDDVDLGIDDVPIEEMLDTIVEDEAPEPPEEPVTKRGDIYLLGDHILMCGDSTSEADVAKLMQGEKADMVFTDPPYNVSFNGRSGNFEVILNDDLDEFEFNRFIESFCSIVKRLNPDCYYIWCNWKFYSTLQTKLPFTACIVWAKNVFGLGAGYRHQHEFCLFNGQIDSDIKDESDLWNIAKDISYVHPTQKPVALCARALKNHSNVKTVVDLFGGSGSTLIACEQTGRKCRMMELDPHYCDVIVRRWEEFTGEEAVLVS